MPLESLGPIAALPIAFLVGSVPTALLIGKLRGVDICQHGSGNIGATNAFRVLGKSIGVGCLVFDIFKGWAPAMAFSGHVWLGEFWRPEFLAAPTWMLTVGLTAIAGHVFSPWVGWHGGKGVATSLGVFLAVAPIPILICLTIGGAFIAATGYVSLGSLIGATLLPILIALIPPGGERPWTVIIMTAGLGLFVIWRHRENIGRLIHGNENRLFGTGRPNAPLSAAGGGEPTPEEGDAKQ